MAPTLPVGSVTGATNADANPPHQAVINIMEAARIAGYTSITFKTENPGQ